MNHYQSIASHFQASIESAAMAVDELAAPLEQAAGLITQALLGDGKVITCGIGADAALAQLFVSHMSCPPERERPALPAINLASDGAALSHLAVDGQGIFEREIRALGQAGDVLLLINSSSDGNPLRSALQAAAERNMAAVILSNSDDQVLATAARDADVLLRPAASARCHTLELQACALHCLCRLIENNLFGDQDGKH